MMIRPIQTMYKGYLFRSRLEARWAVFFDSIGFNWQYEPEGFEFSNGMRYLPDFLVNDQFWFEVKGKKPTIDEMRKIELLAVGTKKWGFIAFGDMSFPENIENKITGTNIIGISPNPELNWTKLATVDGVDIKSAYARYGFYEDESGKVLIDHMYQFDLPILPLSTSRMADVQFLTGHLLPTINLGNGRLYRSEKIRKAYADSKSARFEHGQSGAQRWK